LEAVGPAGCERHGHSFITIGSRINEDDARELVLVEEYVVVCRFARAEYPCVAQKVVVRFDSASDICVDDHARMAVPAAVGVGVGGGKEHDFTDDNKRDRRLEAQFCACTYRQGRRLGTYGDRKRECTSNVDELLRDNCREFAFRDAIWEGISLAH
jgi:hypothetical protein